MSESNAVTVNVNGGGGSRQRGPGLFSNLGRAPWYVQLVLLIGVVYLVVIVGFEILASVYDFAVPTLLDFLIDPQAAGAALGAAISAFLAGFWKATGGAAADAATDTNTWRFLSRTSKRLAKIRNRIP